MSARAKQPILLAIAVVAFGAAAWFSFGWGSALETRDGDVDQTALCSECGHFEQTTLKRLQALAPNAQFLPSVSPAFGPGWKCPKCGQATFYRNPITCAQCGKRFFLTVDQEGRSQAKCPGCGWIRY